MVMISSKKILICCLALLFYLPIGAQIKWECIEENDGFDTVCTNAFNEVVSLGKNSNLDLSTLGEDFIANVSTSHNKTTATLTKVNGIYKVETYIDGVGLVKSNVHENLDLDGNFVFSGDYIEAFFLKNEKSKEFETYYYKGQIKSGDIFKKNGEGDSELFNGDRYIGQYKDGLRSGKGKFTYNNGKNKYEGEFLVGLKHGEGIDFKEFTTDIGKFRMGIFESGTRKYLSKDFEGDKFEGLFDVNGQRLKGKYTWKNGESYEGNYQNNVPNGFGKKTYLSGAYYEGIFLDNKWHGPARYIYEEDNVYSSFVGSYSNGKATNGTFFLKNGLVSSSGEFNKDGEMNGEGLIYTYSEDGAIQTLYQGEFRNNRMNGFATSYNSDGTIYKGQFKDGYWSGLGEFEDQKQILKGYFNKKGLQGEASYFNKKYKYLWEGPFKNGIRDGQGIVTFNSGIKRTATYKNGVFGNLGDELKEDLFISNKRIALVIGNNEYISNPLQYAVKDSEGVSQALLKSGFDVIHIKDATQEIFLEALYELKSKIKMAGPRTDVLFYYAGHASQVKGINYLNPIDTVINRESQLEIKSINMNRVFEVLNESIDGVKIAILDSCRNNPFSASLRSSKSGLAQMNAPPGTIIAYSTAPGETAIDGSSEGYGIYTGSLINSISKPGLRIEEVFKDTRRSVVNLTKGEQVPWESSSLISDFYFIKKD